MFKYFFEYLYWFQISNFQKSVPQCSVHSCSLSLHRVTGLIWPLSQHPVYWGPMINNRSCTKNKGHHWTKQLFRVTFNCNLEFSLLQGLPLSPLVIPNRKRCNLWQCQSLSFKLWYDIQLIIDKKIMGTTHWVESKKMTPILVVGANLWKWETVSSFDIACFCHDSISQLMVLIVDIPFVYLFPQGFFTN